MKHDVPDQLAFAKLHKDEGLSDDQILLEFGDYTIVSDDGHTDPVHDRKFMERLAESYNTCSPYHNPEGITAILNCVHKLHEVYHARPDPVTDAWQELLKGAHYNLWWTLSNLKKR